MAKKQRRGFAAMTPEKQRAIAVEGGRRAQKHGAHRWTPEEARKRASAGGLARAQKARERAAAEAANPQGEAAGPMATESRRRSDEMIATMVGQDLAALQRRGVKSADLTIAPFSGRDSLRSVYEAALLLVLNLRTLIEEESVTRATRSHEGVPTAGGATGVTPTDPAAVLMVHRNVSGRCQFCDEAFPCAFVRGTGAR